MALEPHLQAASHYSSTYMEQLCKALHPDLDVGKACVSWFRLAINHCTNLLSDVRTPTVYFWSTVKSFIFPDRTTEKMWQKVPISIHPNRLSLHDCQTLFLDIVSDYVQRAPRYITESATNGKLWQILYSLLGIMVLSVFLAIIACSYHRYSEIKNVLITSGKAYKLQRSMQYVAGRSLQVAKTEQRLLKIKQEAKREDIIASDGRGTLVLKVGTKYEFLESLVQGCLHTEGKFHRFYDRHEKSKTEFKVQSLKKALQYIDADCQKLHLVLMFEDTKSLEMEEVAEKCPKKSWSPPAKQSPTLFTSTPRQIPDTRLEVGSALQKGLARASTGYRSPRLTTLNQHNSPRSTNTPRSGSGIPRNIQKTVSSPRKSN